jgi:hypothetical protein
VFLVCVAGHAFSWGAGYDIIANCPDYNANINNVPLNPTKALTMSVVQGFLTEMAALFPDDVMHLGGDEVRTIVKPHVTPQSFILTLSTCLLKPALARTGRAHISQIDWDLWLCHCALR